MKNSRKKVDIFLILRRVSFRPKFSFWLFLFICIFLYSYPPLFSHSHDVFAWTPPADPPPADNVPMPLNVGPSAQGKLGNLGIGTTEPGGYQLNVRGESYFTDIVTGTSFYAPGGYHVSPGSTEWGLYILGSVSATGTTNDNYFAGNLGIGTATPNAKLVIRQTGTDDIFNLYDTDSKILTVVDGGQVGIGVDTPTGLLDVAGSLVVSGQQVAINVPLNLTSAGDISFASDLQFTNPTASYIKSQAPLYIEAGDSNYSYDLILRAFNEGEVVVDGQMNLMGERITNVGEPIDDSDVATKGYIDSAGNWEVSGSYLYPIDLGYKVGIGTDVPTTVLDVYRAGASSEMLLKSDADQRSMLYFEDGQTGIYESASSEDLRFWVGSNDRMTIADDGNVGIGTDSPAEKVEIYGTDNKLKLSYDDDNYGTMTVDRVGHLIFDAKIHTYFKYGGNSKMYIGSSGPAIFNDQAWVSGDWGDYGIGYNSTDDSLQFVDGNTIGTNVRMVIDNSGDVGIGTTIPGDKLQVDGNIISGADNTDSLGVASNRWGNVYTRKIDAVGNSLQLYSDVDYRFYNDIGEELVRIDNDGNVGIGTTSPGEKLDVSANTEAVIRLSSTDTALISDEIIGKLEFYKLDSSSGGSGAPNYIQSRTTNLGGAFAMDFITGTMETPYTTMTLGQTGNVGIGTNDPSGILHVVGDGLYLDIQETIAEDMVLTSANASGLAYWKDISEISGVTGSGTQNYIPKWATAGGLTDSAIYESSGKIGIGTTVPYENLNIMRSGAGNVARFGDNVSTKGLIIAIDSSGNPILKGTSSNQPMTITPDGYLVLETDGVERVRILQSNGNVGIGTDNPAVPLEVDGAGTIEGRLTVNDAINSFNGITANNSGSFVSGYGIYVGGSDDNYFAGKVGIGTDDPGSKLSLYNGNFEMSANKSIKIENASANTVLFLGNYADGEGFSYDEDYTASLAVEGDVRGGKICIGDDDCVSNWSQDILGTFEGFTASSYNGNQGGYTGANDICNADYPGSHVCTVGEILYTINIGLGSIIPSGSTGWLSNGPPGYTANANDCQGWESGVSSDYGTVWFKLSEGDGFGSLAYCDVIYPFACCQ